MATFIKRRVHSNLFEAINLDHVISFTYGDNETNYFIHFETLTGDIKKWIYQHGERGAKDYLDDLRDLEKVFNWSNYKS